MLALMRLTTNDNDMTTTHTHTSGPWCIHRGYTNAGTIRCADNGESWDFTHTHIGSGDTIIAQVQHQTKDSGWPHVHDVEEMWANARLIAAAPEMLDALRRLTHPMASDEDLENALAVIAKAEGRNS